MYGVGQKVTPKRPCIRCKGTIKDIKKVWVCDPGNMSLIPEERRNNASILNVENIK